MGLETGTYIEDLAPGNPLGTDPKSQGDDHLRLIKACIKNSFPNTDGAWTTTSAITAGPATADGQLMQYGQRRKMSGGVISIFGTKAGGSNDWSVSRLGLGHYRVTFTQAAAGQYEHSVTANGYTSVPVTMRVDLINATVVDLYITSGTNAIDAAVNFTRVIWN